MSLHQSTVDLNTHAIAEAIRLTLEEARACDDEASEAETRIRSMLHCEFRRTNIIDFKIADRLNFDVWSATLRPEDGRSLLVDHTC